MAPVSAQEDEGQGPWKFKAAIRLWGAGIDGTTRGGNDIDASFRGISDDLDFAFIGSLEARKSKWSAAADVIYLDVSAEGAGIVGPRDAAGGVKGKLHSSKSWFLPYYLDIGAEF